MRTSDTVLTFRRVCRAPKRILKSIKDSSADWYKTKVYAGSLSSFRSWLLSTRTGQASSVPHSDNLAIGRKVENVNGDACRGRASLCPHQEEPREAEQSDWPHIVLVTVSLNDDKVLDECINSVLSQNYPNLTYVLVDIGSTDRSGAIIQSARDHASVKILEGCHDRATGISKALEHP